MKVPAELKYTDSHEWVRWEKDGSATVGVTDFAQESLGDLVFVEVPEVGRTLRAGEACAVVESVKAASDVYSPVSGQVVAGNAALASQPELLNHDPYGAGWLFRVHASSSHGEGLMSAADYESFLADDAK